MFRLEWLINKETRTKLRLRVVTCFGQGSPILGLQQWSDYWLKIFDTYAYNSVRLHDDVIKWKHFPRYGPYVRGFHRSPVNSPHEGQWRGSFMFSLICALINGWVNNREAGYLRSHHAYYDVTVMYIDLSEHELTVNIKLMTRDLDVNSCCRWEMAAQPRGRRLVRKSRVGQ